MIRGMLKTLPYFILFIFLPVLMMAQPSVKGEHSALRIVDFENDQVYLRYPGKSLTYKTKEENKWITNTLDTFRDGYVIFKNADSVNILDIRYISKKDALTAVSGVGTILSGFLFIMIGGLLLNGYIIDDGGSGFGKFYQGLWVGSSIVLLGSGAYFIYSGSRTIVKGKQYRLGGRYQVVIK